MFGAFQPACGAEQAHSEVRTKHLQKYETVEVIRESKHRAPSLGARHNQQAN